MTKAGPGGGTVAGGGINCGTTCSASIASGTAVTLTATPACRLDVRGLERRLHGDGELRRHHDGRAVGDGDVQPDAGDGRGLDQRGRRGERDVRRRHRLLRREHVLGDDGDRHVAAHGDDPAAGGAAGGAVRRVHVHAGRVHRGERAGGDAVLRRGVLDGGWAADVQRGDQRRDGALGVRHLRVRGGAAKAISRTFSTTANASGQVVVQFTRAGGPTTRRCAGSPWRQQARPPSTRCRSRRQAPGSGTVSGASINCGATCSASFDSGTAVTLTASPASGSTFGGWSGACTGTGTCTVTMTAARSVTATFTQSGATFSNSRHRQRAVAAVPGHQWQFHGQRHAGADLGLQWRDQPVLDLRREPEPGGVREQVPPGVGRRDLRRDRGGDRGLHRPGEPALERHRQRHHHQRPVRAVHGRQRGGNGEQDEGHPLVLPRRHQPAVEPHELTAGGTASLHVPERRPGKLAGAASGEPNTRG
ncbi:MAG: hypothetical protein MZV63_19660 [Marinilabiliales bacterium]|nr:hypothetical protein [Marinilabiliales bacterium]